MIGKRLAALRKEHGLSQAKLAEIFDLSNGIIALYETGQRMPSPDKIVKFCDFFSVSSDYLLGLSDIKNPLDSPFALSVNEHELLHLYDKLPENAKELFLKLLLALSEKDIEAWSKYAKLSTDDKTRIQQIIDAFDEAGIKKKRLHPGSA